ncbi:TIGR03619 family F420-dependent LLM class oxidoreductase [uncultured Mycobacterium sp.]|uniref:TIGR03619 family F420-dependent LLM class oxidoreductase n=1 Tax=uncultured Mycobacterium sp. TaxID=171292 RepID=UPI0035CBB09C
MKFTLEYPSEIPNAAPGFLVPDVITRLAVQAEECGFDAIAFSDHPAPSIKWRRGGGHDTIDPAAGLSFVAAVTRRIRLLTNLYVLPFRNPYLAAKNLTSLDILSEGRLTAGIGAGYLRSEFSALGVDFDRRATLLDNGLAALVSIWRQPEEPVTAEGFAATAPLWLSPPVQKPHPPIWIGGNSKAALRRVVQFGQGWCPVIAPPAMASSIRTAVIDDAHKFRQAVEDLGRQLRAVGRDPATVDIQIDVAAIDFTTDGSVRQALERLDEFAELGATWAIVHVDASSVNAAADYLSAFSHVVIGRRHQQRPADPG